jgi:prolyl oligopeptidase
MRSSSPQPTGFCFEPTMTHRAAEIISIDPLNPQGGARELVPESADKLSSAAVIHQTIVAAYMHNASDTLRMFTTLSGEPAGQVDLPEIGSLTGVSGRPEDDEMFFGFTSFTHPAINYRYDFRTRQLEPFGERSTIQFKPDEYETSQVWYRSKDGTSISMFLVARKGLPKDGKRPVLLTGYGGFNISLTPAFDPSNFVLLERGGMYAVPQSSRRRRVRRIVARGRHVRTEAERVR